MNVTRSTVIKSLAWKFLERGSVQLISFIVQILLARILCPEDYGLIALVLVFVNLSNVIVEGGLNMALIQKKNADNLDFSTIFFSSLALSALLYALLFFGSGLIADFYKKPELIPIVRVLGLSLFFYAINAIQRAYLSKYLLFKKQFYSSLGAVVISGIIGLWMALSGYGVWALVAQSITSKVVTTIIMWFTVKWRPQFAFSLERFKVLFNFGWKIFASNMIISFFMNIRSLIIGKVYSTSSLAYFDRGKQFPSLIIENINSSIQSVLFPVLSNEQDNIDTVRAMVRRSIKTSAFVIFPFVTILAAAAGPIVVTLLTDKWIEAVPFIQIFSLAYMLMPMQVANLQAIQALGHSGTTLKIESIKKIIELIILIITIPIGVQAIAWGIVVYNVISLMINTIPNKKLLDYGIKQQICDVLPVFFVSAFMGIIIYLLGFLGLSSLLTLILQVFVGFGLYLFLSFLFKLESFSYIRNIVYEKKLGKSS